MQTKPQAPESVLQHVWIRLALGALGILLLFSLITCDPEDADFLAGGADLANGCRNLFGIGGAYCAWGLYLFLGLAAYVIPLELLAFALFMDQGVAPFYRWKTLAGLLLLPLGVSMLMGLSPGFAPAISQYASQYNIGDLPGGVIGQRLCEPKTGVFCLLANDVACLILSLTIIAACILRLFSHFGVELLASSAPASEPAPAVPAPGPGPTKPAPMPVSIPAPIPAPVPAPAKPAPVPASIPAPAKPVSTPVPAVAADKKAPGPLQPASASSLLTPKTAPASGLWGKFMGWLGSKPAAPAPEPASNLLGRRPAAEPASDSLFKEPPAPVVRPMPASPPPSAPAPVPAKLETLAPPPPPRPMPPPPRPKAGSSEFELPAISLLNAGSGRTTSADPGEIEVNKATLQNTLNSFAIPARVGDIVSGPRVTLYEVVPEPGIKVERIVNIQANIAMDLKAQSIRILAPIPGKSSVGIEIPNRSPAPVPFHDLLADPAWSTTRMHIPILLGRSISGEVAMLDLAKAPHLLIAGATGSGKSVCINTLIMSLLYRFSPDELRLILVDPKVVEFTPYHQLPHLVVPVITEVTKVPLALRWTINEMERRYRVLAAVGCKNIESFNGRTQHDPNATDHEGKPIPARLPFIVVVIDELADIMMTAKQDVETSLAKIAQKSRAVGIHTVVATQRPSVNVITGVIKANFPTRIAFQVTSLVDSRTILDGKGAEALLGTGDMLFKPPNAVGLQRNQGAFVSDPEIERVIGFVAQQRPQQFDDSVFKGAGGEEEGEEEEVEMPELPFRHEGSSAAAIPADDDEALLEQAIEIILQDRKPSISYLQRRLGIGYNKSASLMEKLEKRGVVGPQIGSAPREILVVRPGTATGKTGGAASPDYDPYEDSPR